MSITFLYEAFTVLFVAFVAFDLLLFNRRAHKPHISSTLLEAGLAVVLAVSFAAALWFYGFTTEASTYLAVYVTEAMLSLDNLFVMLLIFGLFKIEREYQHRVLFFGILGAIVFRLVFIFAGAALIETFSWVMYLFAAFLVFTGLKILIKNEHGDAEELKENRVVAWLYRRIPHVKTGHHEHFVVKLNGRWVLTMSAFALIMIELSDVVFALDSIPAAFAITQDPYIILTANVAAILGLRSLFFVVEFLLDKLRFLNYGLGLVLVFIGGKFFAEHWYVISPGDSLLVILSILAIVSAFSVAIPTKEVATVSK